MKQAEDNKTIDMFEENEMNTCDRCAHYTPAPEVREGKYYTGAVNQGECALMSDSNVKENEADRCAGWDIESYGAGVYVGPKFGCIHWIKKETK